MEFDPEVISYEELLVHFWAGHDPCWQTRRARGRRVIFFHDETQRRVALASSAAEEERRGRPIRTLVRPAGAFHLAETENQKYALRGCPEVLAAVREFCPRDEDLLRSTAAARINGFLGGHGTKGELEALLPRLGLSGEGAEALRALVTRD